MSKKGSSTTTAPIPKNYLRRIERLLQEQPRNLLLLTMATNNGLRIGTLLKLRVRDVVSLNPGDTFQIQETKTKKTNILCINNKIYKVLQDYLDSVDLDLDDFLFKSRKGNKALSVSSVSRMVKEWCRMVGLKKSQGNYAAHSLRKSWATEVRKQGVPIEMISMRLNHSSLKTTERYIGLNNKDMKDMLMIEV